MAHPEKYRTDRRQVARRVANRLQATRFQPVALRRSELKYFRSDDFQGTMLTHLHRRVARDSGAKVDITVVYSKRQKLKAVSFMAASNH